MSNQDFESILEGYPVRLQNFEGPLDLLLHLIKKHEIDIYDIPMSLVTQQYLDYIGLLGDLQLDVAGDFLVMAATLIHIKSRSLLPRPAPVPEGAGEASLLPRSPLFTDVHRVVHPLAPLAARALLPREPAPPREEAVAALGDGRAAEATVGPPVPTRSRIEPEWNG